VYPHLFIECSLRKLRYPWTKYKSTRPRLGQPANPVLHVVTMAELQAILELFSFRNIFLLLVGWILYNCVYQVVYYRFFHPLCAFPGPFWGSVTRLWIGWHCHRETELATITKLHEKYGTCLNFLSLKLVCSIYAQGRFCESLPHCFWSATTRRCRSSTIGSPTSQIIM
jgi:hypothetical protein